MQVDITDNVSPVLQAMLFDDAKFLKFGRAVGSQMVYLTQERINQGVGLDGMAWQQSIRAKATGGQTLKDTGKLFNSISYQVNNDTIEWGTNVSYAPYLHYGATIRAKNAEFLRFKTAYGWASAKEVILPPRPFLGYGDEERQSVIDILTELLS